MCVCVCVCVLCVLENRVFALNTHKMSIYH